MAPRFDDFVSSPFLSLFSHLVAPFIAARFSGGSFFAIFATPAVGNKPLAFILRVLPPTLVGGTASATPSRRKPPPKLPHVSHNSRLHLLHLVSYLYLPSCSHHRLSQTDSMHRRLSSTEKGKAVDPAHRLDRERQDGRSSYGGPLRLSPRKVRPYQPYARSEQTHRPGARHTSSRNDNPAHYTRRDSHYSENRWRDKVSKDKETLSYARRNEACPSYFQSSPRRGEHDKFSGVSHSGVSPIATRMREDSDRLAQEEARHASASREVSQDRCFATLPLAAMETALGEVCDVMMQYTRCADPSESAARRECVRQAEAQGQLEESAAQMVRASLARNEPTEDSPVSPHTHNSAGPQMRLPLSSRLGPPQEIHVASSPRIPVMDRLGPLLDEITTDETAATAEKIPQKPKKKLGRPQWNLVENAKKGKPPNHGVAEL
ncbi:hypothetical protein DY000_02001245 [Brassica cretica]|uniref:DUF3741 domain-containing protein n=1 Tax=Brassica cretica TaxID=69181 RepID=A0ABQ7C4N9_BRACR|nr:hypothetical protein DY000_02001245 [Brassica cretica]